MAAQTPCPYPTGGSNAPSTKPPQAGSRAQGPHPPGGTGTPTPPQEPAGRSVPEPVTVAPAGNTRFSDPHTEPEAPAPPARTTPTPQPMDSAEGDSSLLNRHLPTTPQTAGKSTHAAAKPASRATVAATGSTYARRMANSTGKLRENRVKKPTDSVEPRQPRPPAAHSGNLYRNLLIPAGIPDANERQVIQVLTPRAAQLLLTDHGKHDEAPYSGQTVNQQYRQPRQGTRRCPTRCRRSPAAVYAQVRSSSKDSLRSSPEAGWRHPAQENTRGITITFR